MNSIVPSLECAFYDYLRQLPPTWGFLWGACAPFEVQARHWKSLLNVVLPSGVLSHFRFYSGRVLLRQARACTPAELSWLLGPCACLLIPTAAVAAEKQLDGGSENRNIPPVWAYVRNPRLEELAESGAARRVAEAYVLRDRPWWQVTEEHLQAFSPILERVYRENIEQRIWENYPELAREVHEQYGSVSRFVESSLGDARYCGFNTPEHEYRFIMLCLHYDFNVSPGEEARRALALARKDPDLSLGKLEKTLRNPSHGYY